MRGFYILSYYTDKAYYTHCLFICRKLSHQTAVRVPVYDSSHICVVNLLLFLLVLDCTDFVLVWQMFWYVLPPVLLAHVSALSTEIFILHQSSPQVIFHSSENGKCFLLLFYCFCSTMFMSQCLTSIQRVRGQHLFEHVCFGCLW